MPEFSNPADEVSAREILRRLEQLDSAVNQLRTAQRESRAAPAGGGRRGTRPGRAAVESTAGEEISAEERLNRLRREGLEIVDRQRRSKESTTLFDERQARAERARADFLRERGPTATPGGIIVPPARRAVSDPSQLAGRTALADIEQQIAARQRATFEAISRTLQQQGAGAVGAGAGGLGGRTPTYQQNVRAGYIPPALQNIGQASNDVGKLNTQFQRGGALGTEFFDALRVGAVTLSDVRWQLTQTIFKFGGWLVAGSAVFFAADALRDLGAGALDSLEGVNTLQRIFPQIDTERAQQEFRNLAGTMNLPISDVAEAAYGISKVFGAIQDPAEALNATLAGTRAALFAMKVGELDAATATRYFSAIIQGFKLDWRDLQNLVDTANQAQNRFGGSLPQIIQGVAQASGQFGALGGNYRELIALIQTGTRVTGRTGSEIGTGIQRTAEILTRPERRQRIIDLLGIDPQDHSITEVMERAMQVVRHSSRETQTEIARAISTPQLASGRILPILRSGNLYREISNQLGRDQVRGSAQRELDRALQGPRQQISALGINLQRLGSALAQSGVLDGLGLMLRTLNATLRVTTSLVEAFTTLPRPLRTALSVLVEIAAVMALLRRFRAIPGLQGFGPQRAGPLPLPIYSPASAGGPGAYTGSAPVNTVYGGPSTNLGNLAGMSNAERRVRNAGASAYSAAENLKKAGAAGRVAGAGVQAVARAGTGFAASMTRLALVSVNPFDAVIASALILYTQWQSAKARQDEASRRIDELDHLISAGTPEDIRKQKRPTPSLLERASGTFADLLNAGPGGDVVGGPAYRAEQEAYDAAQRTAAARQRAQQHGVDLSQEQVRRHLRERLAGARTNSQRQQAINQAWFELNHSLARDVDASKAQKAAAAQTQDLIEQSVQSLAAVAKNFQRSLDAVSEFTQAQALQTALENQVKVRGLTGRNAGRLAASSARFRELAATASTPSEAQRLLQLADQNDQIIETEAKKRLDRQLEFARNPEEQHTARAAYLKTMYGRFVGRTRTRIDRLQNRVRGYSDDIREAQNELNALDRGPRPWLANDPHADPFGLGDLGHLPGDQGSQKLRERYNRERKKLEDRIKRLRRSRSHSSKQLDDLESTLKDQQEEYEFLRREMARDDFNARLGTQQSAYDARAAGISDPLARARVGLQAALANLRSVRDGFRQGFKTQEELNQALATYRQELQSVAQEILADYQARQGVSSATFALTTRDPVALARHAEQDARAYLQKVRSTPHHDTRDELEARRALLEARKNTADAIRQEAEAMIQAQSQYDLAGTDDPVKQALINLRLSQRLARRAPADSPSGRLQQRAQIRQYQRGYVQAKQQSAYDDIEFEASIGRITQEVELTRLQGFLRTIKGNQALRRQVMQRIYQLKKELEQSTEVELNVGDIRLPTIYDVRRLARMGTAGQMNVRQNFQINVNGAGDPESVASVVFSRMAENSSSGLSSAARASGLG